MPPKQDKPPETQKLVPYLLYKDVGNALKWLQKAFGFKKCGDTFAGKDGTILHASMQISSGGEIVMMGCPGPQFKNPKKLGTTTQMLYINVDNVDKHFARAKKAGAEVVSKLEDTFYGDRRYGVADPEGHQWYFAQHVRDVSSSEMQKAAREH